MLELERLVAQGSGACVGDAPAHTELLQTRLIVRESSLRLPRVGTGFNPP